MKGLPKHERRWTSDTVPGKSPAIGGSSPVGTETSSGEEFVEVRLDLQNDGTIVLLKVETGKSASVLMINIDDDGGGGGGRAGMPCSASASAPSQSPTMCCSSSSRLQQFSHKLKAASKGRQFSRELKAELYGNASRVLTASTSSASQNTGGFDMALAAQSLQKQHAQLDRTHSGARKALLGLQFICNGSVDAWNEVQAGFDKLAKDGYLYRQDFAQCIGMRDSKEFALELFDALGRRRRLKVDKISKDELYEFWCRITEQSFDSRLQIFFDMYA